MNQFGRRQSLVLIGVVAIVGRHLLGPSWAAAQGAFAPGTVVGLEGTPHLWIADAQGILHWAGDTRALAGRYVNWSSRLELPFEQIQRAPRGDPWLSAGLLKDGDPIYLVKWETHEALPRLSHIQSIRDVELFGINENNYGHMVLGRGQWEARYGIRVSDLERTNLAAATLSVDLILTEWPPVAQKHLGFTIPPGWSLSSHAWPLVVPKHLLTAYSYPHLEFRMWPPESIVLRRLPLPKTVIVTTVKRTDDVISVLAVSERDYPAETAEGIRHNLVNTVKDYIRESLLPYTNTAKKDRHLGLKVEKEVTQTTTGVPVWRVKLRNEFRLADRRAFVAYLDYRILKRGNVFWFIEHSRASMHSSFDRAEQRFVASQRQVDNFVNSLAFHYSGRAVS